MISDAFAARSAIQSALDATGANRIYWTAVGFLKT